MTWFKDTAHSLLKDTLWVNYEPDSGKGKKVCSGQEISDGQTEGRTDRQTENCRAPAEWGPKNDNILICL